MLDRLGRLDRAGVLRPRLDRSRIAMVGHCLGGSIAANVMLADRRVDVGVNYDGDYFSPPRGGRRSARCDRWPVALMTTSEGVPGPPGSRRTLVTLAGAEHFGVHGPRHPRSGALFHGTGLSGRHGHDRAGTRPSLRNGRTPGRSWPTTCWVARRAGC